MLPNWCYILSAWFFWNNQAHKPFPRVSLLNCCLWISSFSSTLKSAVILLSVEFTDMELYHSVSEALPRDLWLSISCMVALITMWIFEFMHDKSQYFLGTNSHRKAFDISRHQEDNERAMFIVRSFPRAARTERQSDGELIDFSIAGSRVHCASYNPNQKQ